MKKSVIRALAVSAMSIGSLVAMTGCSGVQGATYVAGTPVKVGLICLHDQNSTYDANFINALKDAKNDLGAEKIDLSDDCILTGVDENEDCYNKAKELVKKGCNLIFADSFGHQDFMLKAAKDWPSVQFCHATGTNAKKAALPNYHNAFASIYEGRFIAGAVAGARLFCDNYNLMTSNMTLPPDVSKFPDTKLGYVGAFSYAEVKSGYTAWFLGVKTALEQFGIDTNKVTMDVRCTGSWYDVQKEAEAATALINGGAVLVSQHADSMGAPGVCEDHNPVIPNVTYNIPTKTDCPKSYIAYSRINWAPYYKNAVNSMFEGKAAFDGESNNNWTGTLATGSVEYAYDIDNVVANMPEVAKESAKTYLEQEFNGLIEALNKGELKVFDVSKFTVTVVKDGDNKKNANATVDDNGHLTGYLADTDGDYIGDQEVVVAKTDTTPGYFNESFYCSAPYFDLDIDGINVVTPAF